MTATLAESAEKQVSRGLPARSRRNPKGEGHFVGRTYEEVTIRNLADVLEAKSGHRDPDQVRTIRVEALVDTGATYLCLPPGEIQRLGLIEPEVRTVKTANGPAERRLYSYAQISIQGRTTVMEILENDPETPPLIGYTALELLDFVVDPKSERLIPNPEHGGKWMADLY
ncbi:MAG: retroviral-like aspartic protease family protein [Candidatus Omnitrophica bacterium]|nr:retroviral-like aspartic protease family protein [Candidatus Omnitrophota bacterium]